MKYLFLFTIGPVQSFIVAARKTSDMLAGSKILSDIIEHVIENEFSVNATLIFPAKANPSKPNRILAKIELDKAKVKNFGDSLIKTAKSYFLETIAKKNNISNENKVQLNNFLKCYWVAVPDTGNYNEDYLKLEKLLGSAKSIREFEQLTETGKVCSMCGERVVKHDSESKPKISLIKQGEGLCSVCMVKRSYITESFPSTADIALMHIKVCFNNEDIKLLEKFKGNGQLLYEENLNENYFKKNNIEHTIDFYTKDLVKINKIISENGLKSTKYYALMAFDGDSIGTWLTGDKIKNDQLEEFHKNFSKCLGEFATQINEYLNNSKGQVIYAGGEDFIGFINLHYLIEAMAEIRRKFKITVSNELTGFFIDENNEITFSAGIAIAHYKHDLQDVVGCARQMEKMAKNNFEPLKDAFAITVLKSDATKTCWNWGTNADNLDQMSIILTGLQKDFSSTFIHKLFDVFIPLIDFHSNKLLVIKKEQFEFTIKQLIERSYMGEKEHRNEKIKAFGEALVNLNRQNIGPKPMDNFFSCLETLDFISKEIHL